MANVLILIYGCLNKLDNNLVGGKFSMLIFVLLLAYQTITFISPVVIGIKVQHLVSQIDN